MPHDHATPLAALAELSRRLHPALQGAAPADGERWIIAEHDNRPTLRALYEHWKGLYPEAGEPYWSVRCWTLLTWQPVFLAVAGVHGAGYAPPVHLLRQRYGNGIVAGFQLPEGLWEQNRESEMIATAGRSLQAVCEELYQQLSTLTRLRRLTARRLVADTLLAALTRLPRLRSELGREHILALAADWLDAAHLTGESALMALPLRDGRVPLALDRKACCMDYRRHDGAVCASCPIQKRPQRIQRLREELTLNADA